ncbi:MAG: hypothetical protein QNJ30_11825 [Kiloniellales bacterium]|nr:hypothetical protein [Kiloniellales bacterium]
MSPESSGLAADLANLDGEVRAAIAAVEAGRVIDVTALDATIRTLCAQAAQAGPGERAAVKSGLAELEQTLGRLAAAIRARTPAPEESQGAAPAERAAAAYAKPQREH